MRLSKIAIFPEKKKRERASVRDKKTMRIMLEQFEYWLKIGTSWRLASREKGGLAQINDKQCM